jgi:hypothetical protein
MSAPNGPSHDALADLLDNAAGRNALIQQLRELAKSAPAAAPPTTSTAPARVDGAISGLPAESGDTTTFSRRIAATTQAFLEGVVEDFRDALAALQSLKPGHSGHGALVDQWISALISLAIVISATLLAYALFRLLASSIYRRIDRWVAIQAAMPAGRSDAVPLPARQSDASYLNVGAQNGHHRLTGSQYIVHWYRYLMAVMGALLLDLGVIVLASVVGSVVGVWGASMRGNLGALDAMFVNAFLAVEIAKAIVRTVFATRYRHLRLLSMTDDIATYWNGWLARLISWTGYGILMAVPLLKAMFSAAVGQLAGLLLMLGVYIYALRVIWRNRKLLRERLERRADLASTAFFSTLIRMLARVWHLLALGYFTVLLVVSQIAPASALPFMARATGQTLIAIVVGLLTSALMSVVLAQRISLSDGMRTRLPMLEQRVNAYVPATLKTLRTMILAGVVLVVLDAWGAFNLPQWLASESGSRTLGIVIHVAIILLIAALLWTVIASIIEHRLSTTIEQGAPSARERTLLALFRNAALVVIVTMTILIVLSQIGIDIAPLIAGAGVTSLNERGFTVRILIKTKPGMQWAIQRGYNRLVKKHFNAANIELPYPHTVIYFGQDKHRMAPSHPSPGCPT